MSDLHKKEKLQETKITIEPSEVTETSETSGIYLTEQTKETEEAIKEKVRRPLPVGFIQIMTVITILIAAVLFRSFGGDLYEQVRLSYVNLLSDPSDRRELFFEAGAIHEET